MSSKSVLKIVKNLLFFVIGLGLLYLAFKDNDLNALVDDILRANYSWVIISMLMGIAAFVSRAIRWKILLTPLGYSPKVSNGVYSIIIGYLANLALPRIGEITRCTVMGQAEDIPVDKLFGTVILERIIDMSILLSTTFLVMALKMDVFGQFFIELFQTNAGRFPNLIPILLLVSTAGILGLVFLYLIRNRLLELTFFQKIKTFILGLKEGLLSVRKVEDKWGFFLHTFLIWFFYYLMTWLVFYALEETAGLTWIDGLFILVVGGFGMAAPVQGGIGAYHLIVSMGLGVLGIAKGPALSYATIVHASQTLVVLVTGFLSMILISVSNRKAISLNSQNEL